MALWIKQSLCRWENLDLNVQKLYEVRVEDEGIPVFYSDKELRSQCSYCDMRGGSQCCTVTWRWLCVSTVRWDVETGEFLVVCGPAGLECAMVNNSETLP